MLHIPELFTVLVYVLPLMVSNTVAQISHDPEIVGVESPVKLFPVQKVGSDMLVTTVSERGWESTVVQ